jgi:hypothetical protein
MGAFVKGDVVIAPFPYSDLTTSKKRPAIVLATKGGVVSRTKLKEVVDKVISILKS